MSDDMLITGHEGDDDASGFWHLYARTDDDADIGNGEGAVRLSST